MAVVAALCACDVRASDDPVAECIDYARRLACLSPKASERALAMFSKPPKDEAGRNQQRVSCSEQRERVRRACR